MKRIALMIALFLTGSAAAPPQKGTSMTSTPAELVDAYNSLADVLLGAKKTETDLVRSILAATYNHAQAVEMQAKAKIEAGEDAKADLETLATLVSQLGNEGDAAVAAVRKRLLEGGHHHHTDAEAKLYDEGFVMVTRASRKLFLSSAKEIARIARAPDADKLDTAWGHVAELYKTVMMRPMG